MTSPAGSFEPRGRVHCLLLAFWGIVMVGGGLAVGVVFFKRGRRYQDFVPEAFVLVFPIGVAAGLFIIGVYLEPHLLADALIQSASAIVAGVVVGIVVVVLTREK